MEFGDMLLLMIMFHVLQMENQYLQEIQQIEYM